MCNHVRVAVLDAGNNLLEKATRLAFHEATSLDNVIEQLTS